MASALSRPPCILGNSAFAPWRAGSLSYAWRAPRACACIAPFDPFQRIVALTVILQHESEENGPFSLNEKMRTVRVITQPIGRYIDRYVRQRCRDHFQRLRRLGFRSCLSHAPRSLSRAPDLVVVSAWQLTVICDVRINGQRDTGRATCGMPCWNRGAMGRPKARSTGSSR
jgi:hypothetical protein